MPAYWKMCSWLNSFNYLVVEIRLVGRFFSKLLLFLQTESTRDMAQYISTQSDTNLQKKRTIEETKQTIDVSSSLAMITWNRRCLNCVGLWPLKVREPIFLFFFVYLFLHCSLGFVELCQHLKNYTYVIANLTENVFITLAFFKICIYRRHIKSLEKFLRFIDKDFSSSSYSNREEADIFLYYNKLTLLYTKVSLVTSFIAGALYYAKVFYGDVDLGPEFVDRKYTMPYRTKPLIPVTTDTIYIIVCVYQIGIVWVVVFAYASPDAFLIGLCLHVCGQLAVLSYKVKDLLESPEGCLNGIRKFVERHQRLIELAQILEDNFNVIYFFQLIGTTFLLCLTVYQTITNSESGQPSFLILYFLYVSCVICTFLTYCYVGECLITESTSLGEALYHSNWYNVSTIHLKLVQVCMVRAARPLILTSGKFCILSLSTFTDILKTSMAYLSVLRNSV